MEIPSGHTTVVIEDDVTFKCLCCHIAGQKNGTNYSPYQVSIAISFVSNHNQVLTAGFLPEWRGAVQAFPSCLRYPGDIADIPNFLHIRAVLTSRGNRL
jgi:hypothetical protein